MRLKILTFLALACCAFGVACKPRGIDNIALNGSGELVVTMKDGSLTNLGKIGGEDGERVEEAYAEDGGLSFKLVTGDTVDLGEIDDDGEALKEAYLDDDGYLILAFSEEKTFNCGKAVYGGTVANDFEYEEVKDGQELVGYTVTGLLNNETAEIYFSPKYKGKPVVGISEEAFKNNGKMESVTVPDSVKSIGARAFSDCVKLKTISVGRGLETTGEAVFARCEGLEKVNVNDIAEWCGADFASPSSNPLYFASTLLLNNEEITDLQIPDSAEKIGRYAFYECENVKSVNTGKGVKEIGESAFFGCDVLESAVIGDGVTKIGEQAFSGCTLLKTLTLGNGLTEIGEYAFANCDNLEEADIPSSVKIIGESAFSECYSLKKVTMRYGLETICDGAFAGCSSLGRFIMPDSVKSIGFGILMNTYGGGFVDPSGEEGGVTEIRVSNSLTEISDYAFASCAIKSIMWGNSVKIIRYSSFFGCGALESIVIPKSVSTVQSYAFHNCDNIKTVYYCGDSSDWNRVFIGRNGNDKLREAKVYFYSEQPDSSGNFWHYVNGAPAVWE